MMINNFLVLVFACIGAVTIIMVIWRIVNDLIEWKSKVNRTIKRMDDMYSEFYFQQDIVHTLSKRVTELEKRKENTK
jgi:hypothetical protein